MAFVLAPVLFLNLPDRAINQPRLYATGFIFGAVVSSVLSYQQAIDCFNDSGLPICYEASRLAYMIHPSYLSLYYILVIVTIWGLIKSFRFKIGYVAIGVVVSLYFIFFIYQLKSIGPWLAALIMIIMLLYTYFKARKRIVVFLGIFITILILVAPLVNSMDLMKSDYLIVKKELMQFQESPETYFEKNKGNVESIKARLIIWVISLELISENPMGVGAGDIKDVLIERYKTNELDKYVEKELNPHNQYLQTSLALGVLVGVYLIAMLVVLLRLGVQTQNYFLVALITLLAVSMLVESMFEKQAGAFFFTFFIYYTLSKYNFKINEQTER